MFSCPGEIATFTCRTVGAALLWETNTTTQNEIISSISDTPGNLGIFRLSVLGVKEQNDVVVGVNSSATTLVGVRLSDNNIQLRCRETTNFTGEEAVLRVNGKKLTISVDHY